MRCGIYFLPIICLGISSCTTAEPGIRVETVKVPVEVQKPCPAEIPKRPEPIGALPTDAVKLAATLGAKLIEWAGPGGYGDRADEIMQRCVTD